MNMSGTWYFKRTKGKITKAWHRCWYEDKEQRAPKKAKSLFVCSSCKAVYEEK